MQLLWSADQIQGSRDYQEDFYGILSTNTFQLVKDIKKHKVFLPAGNSLFIMTDGMGGMGHGDEAATLVLQSFVTFFVDNGANFEIGVNELQQALNYANKTLGQFVEKNLSKQGMGCTLIAAYFDLDRAKASWISVGDSPFWRIRASKITRMNQIHSWGQQGHLLYAKLKKSDPSIIPEYISRQNNPKLLISAVSGGEITLVDSATERLQEGDILIIASDGLETLSDNEISDSFKFAPFNCQPTQDWLDSSVQQLLRKIELHMQQTSKQDNTTVIAVAIHDPFAGPMKLAQKNSGSVNAAGKLNDVYQALWGVRPKRLRLLLTVVLLLVFLVLFLR